MMKLDKRTLFAWFKSCQKLVDLDSAWFNFFMEIKKNKKRCFIHFNPQIILKFLRFMKLKANCQENRNHRTKKQMTFQPQFIKRVQILGFSNF